MPSSSRVGADGKRLIKRLAASYGECREEARRYGACIKHSLDGVERGACDKEFVALSRCFVAAASRART